MIFYLIGTTQINIGRVQIGWLKVLVIWEIYARYRRRISLTVRRNLPVTEDRKRISTNYFFRAMATLNVFPFMVPTLTTLNTYIVDVPFD